MKGISVFLMATGVGCCQGFAQEDKMESLANENATCIQECHCRNKNYTAEGEEIYDRFSQQYRKNFLRDLFFDCFDEGVKKVEPQKKKIYDINNSFKKLLSEDYVNNEGETYTALGENLRDFNIIVEELKSFDPLPIAQEIYNKSLTITLGKKEKYELEKCMEKDPLTQECKEKFGKSLGIIENLVADGVFCAREIKGYTEREIIKAGKENRTRIRKGKDGDCPVCKPCEKCTLF